MKKILLWILKLVPSIIMLQTLYYKFSGAEESVYIFSKLEAEPYGRVIVGVLELVSCILIITTKTTFLGAVLGTSLMLGAIGAHVFVLGITVNNDGGLLFTLAIITVVCCNLLMYLYRDQFNKYKMNLTKK